MEQDTTDKLTDLLTRLEDAVRRLERKNRYHRLEEWLTPEYVMETLNISTRTLQTLRDKKLLHPTRLGGKFFYSRRELEELLEDGYKRSVLNEARNAQT